MSSRQRGLFVAMLAAGALLRIVWVAYAARPPVGLIDPTFYAGHALDLAGGRGYSYLGLAPSAYYPPGYPMALAVAVWTIERLGIGYELPTLVAVVNLVAGLGAVVLVFDIGRRLFDSTVGWLAAALVCFWPNLVFHTAAALSETLCNLLLLGAVALLLRRRDWRNELAAGALLGAAGLVRPVVLPIVAALFVVWALPAAGAWRRALRSSAIVTAAAIVVIAPWMVRNYGVFDQPVLISTNLGDNLCIGNHPGADGRFALPPWCFDGYEGPQHELRRNAALAGKALRWALAHPVEELALLGKRAWSTFHHDHDGLSAVESYGADRFLPDPWRRGLGLTADVWFVVVAAFAAVGYARLRPRVDPHRWIVVAAPVALMVSPLVSFGDARFKVPLVPFLAIAAAVGIRTLVSPRGTPPRH